MKFPKSIFLIIVLLITFAAVPLTYATWLYTNNFTNPTQHNLGVNLKDFIYYDEVVITKLTPVSTTVSNENSILMQPTAVETEITGSAGQKIVYKAEAHNYSKTETYIYAGASYSSDVYSALNKLTVSVSDDAQNLSPINADISAAFCEGTPVGPGENFVFYITYTLTDNIYSDKIMVDYVFKPIIYEVTYLNNNETFAVDYVTNNDVAYNVKREAPENSSLVFGGWVNANAVTVTTISKGNTNNYTLSASWENVYLIIFADVKGNVLYQEQFTDSSTKLSTEGQATVDRILSELNTEAKKEDMSVSWSEYDIANASNDITVKAIYAYAGVLNLVPVYEQPDDGIVDYYKVVAVDTLPEEVFVPGNVGGVPVRVIERIANTEGENDWNNYAGNVKRIVIQEGVERLEWNSLAWTPNLTTVKLPSTINYLAKNTFSRNDIFGNDKKALTIEFNGTKAEWKALLAKSDKDWAGGLKDGSVVKCSDGYFELNKGLFSSKWEEKSY